MAARIGHITGQVVSGNVNPRLSDELDDLTEVVSQFDDYALRHKFQSLPLSTYRMPPPNRRGIVGVVSTSFKEDFYERVHVFPARLDLGTVASTINRGVSVWNAYTSVTAEMDSVAMFNGAGISLSGDLPPLSFAPLQERIWEVRITPNGPPEIDARITFTFSNVASPLPVAIIGNRAVVVPNVPDVPVVERWRWLTDVQVSADGSEQRIGIRQVPRRTQVTKLVFESEQELRDQYNALFGARGRLFIPHFQYATVTTAAAPAGTSSLAFDTAMVDLRNGDYVLLAGPGFNQLVQLDSIGTTNASTRNPLSLDVPKGTKVIAAFASIVPNNLTLNRPNINHRGEMTLSSDAIQPRTSHTRPGASATLRELDGYPVLERRPLANGDIAYTFDSGQDMLDAKTGLFDVATDWDFTKVESEFTFNIRRMNGYRCEHRSGVDEMDYWRKFTDLMKGSLNAFLLSTFRPDQVPAASVGSASDSMILAGGSYADSFWSALSYHYISISTARGPHYAVVTSASKNADGNTAINFTPPLPAGADWADIKHVSYLLKQRIADDTVELEHYALDTIIKFTARTVKA